VGDAAVCAEPFEEYFRRLHPQAVALAVRVVGDSADAGDAAAEAFARAFAAWPKIRLLAWRDAWVLRVTANLCFDQLRRARRALPAGANVPGVADAVVTRVALVTALGALPQRQREVMVLRHLAGYSEDETSRVMGVSLNTVKTHGARATRALRALLEGGEGDWTFATG